MENTHFKNILIPTDFSVSSDNAVEHALAIAAKTKANVTFLHSYHIPTLADANGQNMFIEDYAKKHVEDAKVLLHNIQKRAVMLHPDLQVDNLILEDFFTDAITSICDKKKIDLVVMGTKGASGFDEYFLGSNTALVVESVKCPVLVIPENAMYRPYKKLLYASDFQFDDLEALSKLISVADLFGATLEVVHISKNSKEDEELMDWFRQICEERSPYQKIGFSNIPQSNTTLNTLNKLIHTKGIDLVSMSSTNKSFLKRIFTGSLTEKMAYHTDVPFLAFHIQRDNKL